MITTTDPGGLVKIVTLTKHENIQTDQQQQLYYKNLHFAFKVAASTKPYILHNL